MASGWPKRWCWLAGLQPTPIERPVGAEFPHVVALGPVGGPFGPPTRIVGCTTCLEMNFGNPNHSKCGKTLQNTAMTRSPLL
jgi:hypothetical protein